jgi:membrane-bound ClpP family serine protease
MKKIIPKITPFLVLGIYLIVLSIYTFITDGISWGGVAAMALFIFALILILIDFAFKKFIKKNKQILFTELIIGVIVIVWYYLKFN